MHITALVYCELSRGLLKCQSHPQKTLRKPKVYSSFGEVIQGLYQERKAGHGPLSPPSFLPHRHSYQENKRCFVYHSALSSSVVHHWEHASHHFLDSIITVLLSVLFFILLHFTLSSSPSTSIHHGSSSLHQGSQGRHATNPRRCEQPCCTTQDSHHSEAVHDAELSQPPGILQPRAAIP